MIGEPARIVPALVNDPARVHENRRRRIATAFRSTATVFALPIESPSRLDMSRGDCQHAKPIFFHGIGKRAIRQGQLFPRTLDHHFPHARNAYSAIRLREDSMQLAPEPTVIAHPAIDDMCIEQRRVETSGATGVRIRHAPNSRQPRHLAQI
jgi:hypothetical protein